MTVFNNQLSKFLSFDTGSDEAVWFCYIILLIPQLKANDYMSPLLV